MLAGEAKRMAAGVPNRRYAMLDKLGHPRWHFVWEGNPNIARPGEKSAGVIGYVNGKRHYMVDVKPDQYTFKEYQPTPAFIQIERQLPFFAQRAAGAVVYNPNIKPKASPNKAWGLEHWDELIALTPGVRWIQLMEPGTQRIGRSEKMDTGNFLDAVAAMSKAAAVVCHEGALHHAAAAFGVPTIVIRGGFISPKVTGYAGQVDFYVEDARWPLGCGMRVACDHCRAAMDAIKPDAVAQALLGILKSEGRSQKADLK